MYKFQGHVILMFLVTQGLIWQHRLAHLCYLSWMVFNHIRCKLGCTNTEHTHLDCSPGPKAIIFFSCSTQLKMKFKLPINIEITKNERNFSLSSDTKTSHISC